MDPYTSEVRLMELINNTKSFSDKRKADEAFEGRMRRTLYSPVDTYKYTAVIIMNDEDWSNYQMESREEDARLGITEYAQELGCPFFPSVRTENMRFSGRKMISVVIGIPKRNKLDEWHYTTADIEDDLSNIIRDVLKFTNYSALLSSELKLICFDKVSNL